MTYSTIQSIFLTRLEHSIYALLSILFLPVISFGQESISIENGKNYDQASVIPFLNELYLKNDLVISFRVKSGIKTDSPSSYFVLTRKDNTLKAFKYETGTDSREQLTIPASSLDLIWKTFQQNELLKIKDEKELSVFCAVKYNIFNSHTYEFEILSKGKMKKLSYYDPEYYDNVCFGMEERAKIINSVSVINYILSEARN